MIQAWQRVIGIFGAWILMALAVWTLLPTDWPQWIKWIPIMFIGLALIIAGVGILMLRIGFFKSNEAFVKGKVLTACLYCHEIRSEKNIVNSNFLICKCSAKDMRTIYTPGKIPRWCPYVIR